jgi:hypothetical protein
MSWFIETEQQRKEREETESRQLKEWAEKAAKNRPQHPSRCPACGHIERHPWDYYRGDISL